MEKKWAIVTGASSGIGREFCRELSKNGYSLVMVARRYEKMETLKSELMKNRSHDDFECLIMCKDLSRLEALNELYDETLGYNVDVIINCSGFGDLGEFSETSIEKELSMIDVNIRAVHVLTKKFLKRFLKDDRGYILNVASSAGLLPAGPYMSTYYATKAYVTSLTSGIAGELRDRKSNVYVGALCPGPVKTSFNDVANCNFKLPGIDPNFCAKYALIKMFARKEIIVPSIMMQTAMLLSKVVPRKILVDIARIQQYKKVSKN